MSVGACGIDCGVCRLSLLGVCSTCGSGKSSEGFKKFAAQQRILGAPCPVLECAIDKNIDYCARDCSQFPCDRFRKGPYPFSDGFLNMQERRRKEIPPLRSPSGYEVDIPDQYWEDLEAMDLETVCKNTLAEKPSPGSILLPFLDEYVMVDIRRRLVQRHAHEAWKPADNPLLELLCLVFLLNAGPETVEGKMVGVNELRTGHFFRGPHELKVQPLVERFGNDIDGFKRACEAIGGRAIDMADTAYMFRTFPKVPLYYLLWEGDEEFRPRISVLFDRSIEHHLAGDTIWGLVNLISDILLKGDLWHTN